MHRGPLHYAFDIARSSKVLAQNAQQPLAVDLEFDATETWQYAINPSTLTFHAGTPAGGVLPSPVFDSGLSPFTISVTACPIDWAEAGDTFAAAPPTDPACTGAATNITLSPFGVSALPFVSRGLAVTMTTLRRCFRSPRSSASASSRRSRQPEHPASCNSTKPKHGGREADGASLLCSWRSNESRSVSESRLDRVCTNFVCCERMRYVSVLWGNAVVARRVATRPNSSR